MNPPNKGKILQNLAGHRFGRLIVQRMEQVEDQRTGMNKTLCHCLCDCGNKMKTVMQNLKTGQSKSCGCLADELFIERMKVARMAKQKK